MELYEAHKLIINAKAIMHIDGKMIVPRAETQSVLALLGRHSFEMISHLFKKESSNREDYTNLLTFLNILRFHALSPKIDSFDLNALQSLHKKLFHHIKGAGIIRKNNKELASASCIDFKLLPASLRSFFSHMNKLATRSAPSEKRVQPFSQKNSPTLAKNDFATLLASLYREFLILSPFIVGNTIVAKVFFEFFANSHKFSIEYNKVRAKEFNEAEVAAIVADDAKPLFNVFSECLVHLSEGCISHQYSLPQGIE
ncbi:MAG: Fic family protein [Firmicutes bacterium]|nr:Fic family protein [Bacillota bacterium]